MEDLAIEVNSVWKKYKIGQTRSLTKVLPLLFSPQKQKHFWALKKINLRVKKGEILGIIGPNGSGKSTFLKILSGITTPTKGSVVTSGKVASLLELGTGFHPELTGRENIYLYGAILGMPKNKIREKFEEIVIFSGIKKFLDTPVKHYSSGMYIRLAFSVAIHLDWDILLVDEVLGVGDIEFQKKSLSKIEQSLNARKTLILVSHDLNIIRKFSSKILFIKDGKIQKSGKPDSVINYYLKHV